MSQNSCCVPGCAVVRRDGVFLHIFPNPIYNIEKFTSWVSKIGGQIASMDHHDIYHNRRVCHRHFEDIHKYPNGRLSKLAIPTLHIPDLQAQSPAEAMVVSNSDTFQRSPLSLPLASTSNATQSKNFVSGIKQEVLEISSIKEELVDDEGAFNDEMVPEEMVMRINQSCCSDDYYNERENFVAIKQEVPEDSSIEVNCADEGALDNEMLKGDIAMDYGASYYSDGQNFVAIKHELPEDSSKVECADEGGSDNEILQEYMVMEYNASCYSDGQYNVSGTKKIKREAESDDEYNLIKQRKRKKLVTSQKTKTTKTKHF